MPPLALLLIGMAVVLAGVLWLRLHAFLALILAALTISLLTPHSALEEFSEGEIRKEIGFLFQMSALFDSMDVGQNV